MSEIKEILNCGVLEKGESEITLISIEEDSNICCYSHVNIGGIDYELIPAMDAPGLYGINGKHDFSGEIGLFS